MNFIFAELNKIMGGSPTSSPKKSPSPKKSSIKKPPNNKLTKRVRFSSGTKTHNGPVKKAIPMNNRTKRMLEIRKQADKARAAAAKRQRTSK